MLSSTELIAAFDESEKRLGKKKATAFNLYCEGFFKGVEVGKADLAAAGWRRLSWEDVRHIVAIADGLVGPAEAERWREEDYYAEVLREYDKRTK